MRVDEVFHVGTLTCEASDPLAEVARKMTDDHVGALAVLDNERIVGIISERDVVRAIAERADPQESTALSFATQQLETATVSDDTKDVARRMLDAGVRHLPVKQGHMVIGVISMRDLLAIETWL
ncbi:CBS domain-containing protein [Saccharopolyspora sp. WRP15-2]|uniref:CBS domain-containing protein n=1 Tax=Saccharopolyspora oryzae TaxID=2997343 RepID=A0ABT4V430_9PSEU|nr:CBS domain-containing protein [Saccharopolyspora oryzae]MDA3628186.1 CBS domain-containing protein [Saccharopolyspora oryzae]